MLRSLFRIPFISVNTTVTQLSEWIDFVTICLAMLTQLFSVNSDGKTDKVAINNSALCIVSRADIHCTTVINELIVHEMTHNVPCRK